MVGAEKQWSQGQSTVRSRYYTLYGELGVGWPSPWERGKGWNVPWR